MFEWIAGIIRVQVFAQSFLPVGITTKISTEAHSAICPSFVIPFKFHPIFFFLLTYKLYRFHNEFLQEIIQRLFLKFLKKVLKPQGIYLASLSSIFLRFPCRPNWRIEPVISLRIFRVIPFQRFLQGFRRVLSKKIVQGLSKISDISLKISSGITSAILPEVPSWILPEIPTRISSRIPRLWSKSWRLF